MKKLKFALFCCLLLSSAVSFAQEEAESDVEVEVPVQAEDEPQPEPEVPNEEPSEPVPDVESIDTGEFQICIIIQHTPKILESVLNKQIMIA